METKIVYVPIFVTSSNDNDEDVLKVNSTLDANSFEINQKIDTTINIYKSKISPKSSYQKTIKRVIQRRDVRKRTISAARDSPTIKITESRVLSGSRRLKSSFRKSYYPSAYITNPCDQLFGPCPLDSSQNSESHGDISINEANDLNINQQNTNIDDHVLKQDIKTSNDIEKPVEEYIPAPRWTKSQNLMMEEMFRMSRFPKSTDIKTIAEKMNVMVNDVEEWFRKRRGKDRKTKRKNENLKSLIDNYIGN